MTRSPSSTEPPPDESLDRRHGRDVSTGPGDGSLSRLDAVKDERIRRWDIVTPSATLIGRTSDPRADVSENVRRLHDEQHPAMQGHSARMHRLEKARITHAFCNTLSLTPWERDRALGIIVDLDLTAFGSQRAIQKVALVVIQYVVDDERKHRLGLHDDEWVADLNPDEMQSLFDRFESLKDDQRFQDLLDRHDLDVTSVNRLGRTLSDQLDEQDLRGAALGRSPYRDPSMPAIRSERPSDSDGDNDADASPAEN